MCKTDVLIPTVRADKVTSEVDEGSIYVSYNILPSVSGMYKTSRFLKPVRSAGNPPAKG